MNRPTSHTLLCLLWLLTPMAAGAAPEPMWPPEDWKPVSRQLRLHERPSASELEVRVTRTILSVVQLMDGQVDLEHTTLKGAGGRIRMEQNDDDRLLLYAEEDLKPGERLPLSVAYRDGKRLELMLVRDDLRTDLRVRVYQRPPPTQEEQETALAQSLSRLTVDYEEHELLRRRMTCSLEEEEAPRVGGSGVHESRYRCEPVPHDCGFELPSWLHRWESAGRLTVNGEEGGGGREGMMVNSMTYWMPLQTVVVLSVLNLDPDRRWRPGDYALRREATGETVRLRATHTEVPEEGVDFGTVGWMSFVIDTARSGTERFVLEVLEKDGGPRRIRMEGMTFEEPNATSL